MLHLLPAPLHGAISVVLLVLNTLVWSLPLFAVAFAKLLVPIPRWRHACSRALAGIAERWIYGNNTLLALTQRIHWDVRGADHLDPNNWYLVICNHVSSADIAVLQRTFTGRIPFIKFFIKQELRWVPILGLAWWVLEFPFVKRYSREALARRPELRKRDQETTLQAARRFRRTPTTLLNFLEGTRFTAAKHAAQQSPYHHLLRPRAGGMALTIGAMGDRLRSVLNVTLVYPDGRTGLWDMLSGRIRRIIVHVEELAIPADLRDQDYAGDPLVRERFQQWVNQIWQEKDALIQQLAAS